MKLPNGYGSVYKLKGNRRKPWAVRITLSHDENYHMKYKYLGYYETQAEALAALAKYHNDPHSLDNENITFEDLYKIWSAEHYTKVRINTQKSYRYAYNLCGDILKMPMQEIKRAHLQKVVDTCGKNYARLKALKILMTALFKFAMENDIVNKNYAQFVDINQYKDKNPNARPHKIFEPSEIDALWASADDEFTMTILMLIYSGCRISEFIDLKKESINLSDRYIDIRHSKTDSGIRRVPIADKVMDFYKHWMSKPGNFFLMNENSKFTYQSYLKKWYEHIQDHTPHDARHTCISLLASKGIDERIIRRIVGHSGKSLTDSVYTHYEFEQLLEAINKI